MTFPTTTISRPLPMRRRWPIGVVAAAIVAGVAIALVAVFQGTSSEQTGNSVLSSLTPSERAYVQAVTSLTPSQLEAAFGTGNSVGTTPEEQASKAETKQFAMQLSRLLSIQPTLADSGRAETKAFADALRINSLTPGR
jgi:hypothetical protein